MRNGTIVLNRASFQAWSNQVYLFCPLIVKRWHRLTHNIRILNATFSRFHLTTLILSSCAKSTWNWSITNIVHVPASILKLVKYIFDFALIGCRMGTILDLISILHIHLLSFEDLRMWNTNFQVFMLKVFYVELKVLLFGLNTGYLMVVVKTYRVIYILAFCSSIGKYTFRRHYIVSILNFNLLRFIKFSIRQIDIFNANSFGRFLIPDQQILSSNRLLLFRHVLSRRLGSTFQQFFSILSGWTINALLYFCGRFHCYRLH